MSSAGPQGSPSAVLRARNRDGRFRRLLRRLFVLLKAAQMREDGRDLFLKAVTEFMPSLGKVLDLEGELAIVEKDGYLFLNGIRAQVSVEGFAALKFLVQALIGRELSGISFLRGITKGEIERFMPLFAREEGIPCPFEEFEEALREHDIVMIRPIPRIRRERPRTPKTEGERTFLKTIFVQKQCLEGLRSGCILDLRLGKQIIQGIVEHLLEEEACLLALDSLRDRGPHLFHHSVRVAVVSVWLGRMLDLGPELLGKLGVAALFHDLGVEPRDGGPVVTPEQVAAPPTREQAIESFRRFVLVGCESDLMRRAALVASELHRDEAEEGIGGAYEERGRSLLGRIVALSDAFDRKTLGREDLLEAGERAAAELRWEGEAEDAPLIGLLQRLVADAGVKEPC